MELTKYNKEEIKQFWIGLMEGDGSFQVNPWKYKYLQYRLVIKLKHTEANEDMLHIIAKTIGGSCRVDKDFVIWVMNNKTNIVNTLKIFETYPPLTIKAMCGIKFMLKCLEENNMEKYLATRENKYAEQANLIATKSNINFEYPNYWGPWLAGFTEAEGCWCIRESGSPSYSIAQKYEVVIIRAIKEFFNISSNLQFKKGDMWLIETSAKAKLEEIITFFNKYPFLGEKGVSFSKFKVIVEPLIEEFKNNPRKSKL